MFNGNDTDLIGRMPGALWLVETNCKEKHDSVEKKDFKYTLVVYLQ